MRSTEFPIQSGDFLLTLLEKLRVHVAAPQVVGEEGLQSKIETADLARAGFGGLRNAFDDAETYPQAPQPVALNS